jgi:DHA1 family bicyclomycin/chloramphenicol resistance-like MFS transporter
MTPRDPAVPPPADHATLAAKVPPIWLLVMMVGAGPFTIQLIVPLLPEFNRIFATGTGSTQLLLTLALAGVAFGQLLYGPLSDRFGRLPAVSVGFAIFMMASLAAAASQALGVLVLWRTLQAVGGCSGMVIGRAMIRDCFPREQAASVLGYVMMGMTVAPMMSPIIGSLMLAAFGWPSVFLLCAVIGAALLAGIRLRLPETLPAPQPLPGLAGLLRLYGTLLRLPGFNAFAATVALSSGVFFTFIGGAPHIVVEGMGRSPQDYAVAFLLISGFFGVGNFVAGRYSQRAGVVRMIGIGTGIAFIGTLAALGAMWLAPRSMYSLFLPAAVMAVGNGMSQTNAMVGALSVRPPLAGTASGLAGCIQMLFGALLSWLAGVLEDGSGLATCGLMLASALLTQLLLAVARRRWLS